MKELQLTMSDGSNGVSCQCGGGSSKGNTKCEEHSVRLAVVENELSDIKGELQGLHVKLDQILETLGKMKGKVGILWAGAALAGGSVLTWLLGKLLS